MNVGQVEFSVSSKTLESVLASAKELQGILNGIDGKTYGAGRGGSATRRATSDEEAYNRAVKKSLQNEKEKNAYLTKVANQEIKTRNLGLKERFKTSKRIAKLDKEENAAAARYHRESERRIKEQMAWRKQDARNKDWADKKEREQLLAQEKALGEATAARAEYQKGVQRQLVNFGAQMQTLGATLQRVTSPFTNVYRGITMGIGYRLLGKVMDSISGAFSRYDTIKTYGKVLTNLGIDATKKFSIAGQEATDVYHNLENAVLGLPTGIDEIIESMRRYAGATGEAEKATKLAIAANNAYIAGNMGEREKLFTERQLVALAGGAELSTNQWDSLRRNAPLAMKVIAKEMKMSVQEMVDSLKQGKISGQEFLDVFIKAGTEGKIKDAAQVMKVTWDAVSQNIQNRMNAMGENILNTLDEVFTKLDGRTFLQHVLGFDKNNNYIKGQGIRGVIDSMSEGAQKWIKANPDKILKFFDNLQKIDWKGIVGGFAEMGLYLGKFYSGLGKIFGNGTLIKWMINFNILGKILQTAGGFTKGLAWPISKVMTAIAFGGGKHDGSKMALFFSNLAGAGKNASAAAANWQGVASYAITIAAIPALAWSLKETALALQEIGKIDINWFGFDGLISNLGKMALALGTFAGLAGGLGYLTSSSGPFGWAGAVAEGIGTAEIAAISKTMKWLGEGLNAIANAKIPSVAKISHVMDTVKQIEGYFTSVNPFEAIGKIFDSWTKTAEFKAVKSIGDAFEGIVNIASFKMPKKWKQKSLKRMGAMKDIVDEFEELFLGIGEASETIEGKATRNGGKTKTAESVSSKMQSFASTVQSMSSVFTDMVGIVDNAVSLNSKLKKIQAKIPAGRAGGEESTSMWGTLRQNIKSMVEEIYNMLSIEDERGISIYEKLGEISMGFEGTNLEQVSTQLDYIPKIIGKLVEINQKLAADTRGLINTNGTGSYAGLKDKLKPLFDAIGELPALSENIPKFKNLNRINHALERIKTTYTKLKELSSLDTAGVNLTNIKTLAATIKEALAAFDEISEKKISIEFKADITGQDQVVKDVKDAIADVKKKVERLDATITKKIYARLTTGSVTGGMGLVNAVKARIQQIKDKIAALNGNISKGLNVDVGGGGGSGDSWHTGGRIGSKVQYRAHGGSIFQPRGVDTIPAMLAEGEYVVNRMAANAVGYDVLQKINHMDIAGAIKGLYSRTGNISTVNNTKNANLTINNYNSPSVGFNQGNRWVQSL